MGRQEQVETLAVAQLELVQQPLVEGAEDQGMLHPDLVFMVAVAEQLELVLPLTVKQVEDPYLEQAQEVAVAQLISTMLLFMFRRLEAV